jgi:hypothetical protein
MEENMIVKTFKTFFILGILFVGGQADEEFSLRQQYLVHV